MFANATNIFDVSLGIDERLSCSSALCHVPLELSFANATTNIFDVSLGIDDCCHVRPHFVMSPSSVLSAETAQTPFGSIL